MDTHARNAEIIRLRRMGLKPGGIARRLEVTPGVVSGVLHRAGLTTEAKGRGFGLSPTEKASIRADRAKGLTFAAIGERHGVHLMTAFKYCRDARA